MDKVRVPVDLLLDSALTASTKVLWMALRLYPEIAKGGRPSRTRLAALTGLSRPTIRKGLARLTEAGWYGLP
ncbi:MAG TPA: helix-turn-helix domain-containing protein [Bacillota bacterium]|nr:helix-turn-helix domain-containing protein [Bacillota bacterium]